MNTLVRAQSIAFDEDSMQVRLSDGRVLSVPLAWFPRLLHVTAEQRMNYTLSTRGIHWEELDEDISVEGLLAGTGDLTHRHATAA